MANAVTRPGQTTLVALSARRSRSDQKYTTDLSSSAAARYSSLTVTIVRGLHGAPAPILNVASSVPEKRSVTHAVHCCPFTSLVMQIYAFAAGKLRNEAKRDRSRRLHYVYVC